MECWGAQGGGYNSTLGGKGAYCFGILQIAQVTNIYIYVGSAGSASFTSNISNIFNGGGPSIYQFDYNDRRCFGTGGGATDIRLQNGNWDNFNSLKSRIMVAAAGGGGETTVDAKTLGGPGAGLSGGASYKTGQSLASYGTLSSQTGGYQFGVGQNGVYISNNHPRGGGGGGYYGGVVPKDNELGGFYASPGFGGSSFISGHSGCNAVKESSTSSSITHTGQPNHYSGYVFTNTVMKAGDESMPSPTGGTETGHSGNGYCKITWHPSL